jgi:hypothetical protein
MKVKFSKIQQALSTNLWVLDGSIRTFELLRGGWDSHHATFTSGSYRS